MILMPNVVLYVRGSLGSLIGAQGTAGEHIWGAEAYDNIIARVCCKNCHISC